MKLTWSHKGEIEYEREQAEARGEARGKTIGITIGEVRGASQITKMNAWLSDSDRSDDLVRSFKDLALQQKLLAEYQAYQATVASV